MEVRLEARVGFFCGKGWIGFRISGLSLMLSPNPIPPLTPLLIHQALGGVAVALCGSGRLRSLPYSSLRSIRSSSCFGSLSCSIEDSHGGSPLASGGVVGVGGWKE